MLKEFSIKRVQLSNGETLGYRECGKGDKILVLVHGNMSSSKHWDLLMEQLEESYKIYAVDLRGFGVSTYNNPINSLLDFAEDIREFTKILNLEKFSMIGWSTGGGVIMEYAASYPHQVENLVLLESVGVKGYPMLKKDGVGQIIPGEYIKTKEQVAEDMVQVVPVLQALKNRDKNFYRMIWELTIYTNNKPEEERYEEYLEDMLTQRNLVDVDYALITFNITDESNGVVEGSKRSENIIAPTLILQGERDYVVPPAFGVEIEKHIKNSKLVMLSDCGHSPFVDCLDKLVSEIKAFIR
jgi:2-hydroxy-6-oxonona-2,4-dienedioate hydrolase